MSNLTTNDRYSFDNMSAGRLPTTNVTLPKSQPVRLKPLLHLCESDEDDDDDESEEKPHQSEPEDELDFDELLLQNDSIKDAVPETFVSKSNINSSSIESTDGILKTTCILPKETHEVVANTSSVQREVNFTTNKEQYKTNDVKDPNKLEIYSLKHDDKTQEFHNKTFPSKNQADTIHNHSTNITLPPPSLSVYKGDYSTKLDTNKNLQSISNNQVYHENACMSDILNKRKEGSVYGTSENKILLTRNSELNLSKDDQRYKGSYSFIEQANKDCEEESYKILNALSESATCTSQTSENLMRPVGYSLQKNIMKYDVNEKYTPAKNTTCTEFSTPSLTEASKSLTNRLVLETPLKHAQVSVHPSPCISHKQLFQTPQNKLSSDMNKSHVQTPSTTLSSWYHNTVRPMESKSSIARDHVQISKIRTPIIEKSDSSRFVIYSVILSYNHHQINN